MNARSWASTELSVEKQQVPDVLYSIIHTILFHRTSGKITFSTESNGYTVGTIGFEDIDCDHVDFTYVRVNSLTLIAAVRRQLDPFITTVLSSAAGFGVHTATLQFYERRPAKSSTFGAFFSGETVLPWEIWNIKIRTIPPLTSENDRCRHNERLSNDLTNTIITVCQTINQNEYVPRMPTRKDEINLVMFDADAEYRDVNPYLFRFRFSSGSSSSGGITTHTFSNNQQYSGNQQQQQSPSVQKVVKKVFKDTLQQLL